MRKRGEFRRAATATPLFAAIFATPAPCADRDNRQRFASRLGISCRQPRLNDPPERNRKRRQSLNRGSMRQIQPEAHGLRAAPHSGTPFRSTLQPGPRGGPAKVEHRIYANSGACSSEAKSQLLCVPSQNGFFAECPQRQSA